MGLFSKKKKEPVLQTKKIPDEVKICELYTGTQNKFGTYVLSTIWLCKKEDYFMLDNEGESFKIDGITWNGENIISDTISITNTSSDGKSKRTGRYWAQRWVRW